MMTKILYTIVFIIFYSHSANAKDYFSREPFLQLDTGGHHASIKDILFTSDGDYLVSAGDDKVIRIWDWHNKKTVRKIYGQVGTGNAGKIFAIALSSDDRWLAVAGWFDKNNAMSPCCGIIRLYDFQTGKLNTLLEGHTNAVHSLSFSNDGKYLVSGSSDKTAIVWDISKRKIFNQLKSHNSRVNAVAFTPNGKKIITTSYDGDVLLWNLKGDKPERVIANHKSKITSLAVHKTGLIASGSSKGNIHISKLDSPNYSKKISNNRKSVSSLSFSTDGNHLVSTCGFTCGSAAEQLIWDTVTFTKVGGYDGHDNTVRKVKFHPKENIVATAGGANHEIHIWSLNDTESILKLKGLGKTVWSTAFTKDQKYIVWGTTDPCKEQNSCPNKEGILDWQLRLPAHQVPIGRPKKLLNHSGSFVRVKEIEKTRVLSHKTGGKYKLDDGVLDLHINGKLKKSITRKETDGMRHSAYSFVRQGEYFISSGAHGILTAYYGNTGQKIADLVGHTNNIWSIAISEKNNFLISASSDQTLKLWDTSQIDNNFIHKPIISLFHAVNGEFVMWVPQGYYYSSDKGDKFVGWIMNQGPAKESRYITARALRHHLYNPELVRKAILLRNSEKAITELRGEDLRLSELLRNKPPEFKIVSHKNKDKISGKSALIQIQVTPNKAVLKKIEIFVNKYHVTPSLKKAIGVKKINDQNLKSFEIPIQKGKNNIRVILKNDWGQTEKFVNLEGENKGNLDRRGKLYLISIGVDHYPLLPPICSGPGGSCELNYAGKDAQVFFKTIQRKTRRLYKPAKSSILLTNNVKKLPNSANIRNALNILRKAKDEDIVIFFLSGHGVIDGDDYLFLPTNAKQNKREWDYDSVLTWRNISDALSRSKGKRLMFIDSCHSGGAYNARFAKDTSDHEILAFSATDEKSVALELPNIKHGAFAYALIQGLNGEADKYDDDKIFISELMAYVMNRVPKLTNEEQLPEINARKITDFVIAQ